MFPVVHIVGCGTIGSNLAIALAIQGNVKSLFLYDMDVVSREGTSFIFPFSEKCRGLFKTHVVKDCIKCLVNSSVAVETKEIEVTKPIDWGLVLDCRDQKLEPIHCDARFSLDRHILVIDSREEIGQEDFSTYVLSQEAEYLSLAISIISLFLKKKNFRRKEKILYDLETVSDKYELIL